MTTNNSIPVGSARVILNADDFGLTDGVSAGIVHLIRHGVLTSTSAMVCVPGALENLARWSAKIPGRIGAHLQLTTGSPVLGATQVPSLARSDGRFPASRKQITAPNPQELRNEWQAQIETLIHLGIQITHLDSHHHVHGLPTVFPVFCEIARYYNLPARPLDDAMALRFQERGIPCVHRSLLDWYGGDLSVQSLLSLLERGMAGLPAGPVVEVMCHPAFDISGLEAVSKYVVDRQREFEVLQSPQLFEAMRTKNLQLDHFNNLALNQEVAIA
ncbi:MAG TPA: ChbG/HpnK family deacetylase [Terriglobia bacterium]|nr:ChbG/HpnK family deacetylase [Terriglobia bacterium]